MARGIFLVERDRKLVEMKEQRYDSEALLQELLQDYPALLGGEQMNEERPLRWLLVAREAGLPSEHSGSDRWSVDHLFLDQDGVPTLVEVKRSTDTRIRREVVGQMLDYAANAVIHWPVEALRAKFDAQCAVRGVDPTAELSSFLGDDTDTETFWTTVKTNLQAGRIRMLFVADEIPAELRRIVEFLYSQMDPAEVLAVEIRQYLGEGLRTLVPTVVGRTSEGETRKRAGSTAPARQWDEPAFFEELAATRPESAVRAARGLLNWAVKRADRIWWGRGAQTGSFVPIVESHGRAHQVFSVWTAGSVSTDFAYYRQKPPFDDPAHRKELLRRLNAVRGVALPETAIDKRPGLSLERLGQEEDLAAFLSAYDWFIDEIRKG